MKGSLLGKELFSYPGTRAPPKLIKWVALGLRKETLGNLSMANDRGKRWDSGYEQMSGSMPVLYPSRPTWTKLCWG